MKNEYSSTEGNIFLFTCKVWKHSRDFCLWKKNVEPLDSYKANIHVAWDSLEDIVI